MGTMEAERRERQQGPERMEDNAHLFLSPESFFILLCYPLSPLDQHFSEQFFELRSEGEHHGLRQGNRSVPQ